MWERHHTSSLLHVGGNSSPLNQQLLCVGFTGVRVLSDQSATDTCTKLRCFNCPPRSSVIWLLLLTLTLPNGDELVCLLVTQQPAESSRSGARRDAGVASVLTVGHVGQMLVPEPPRGQGPLV